MGMIINSFIRFSVGFVFTVKTDNTGTSNNDQFTIPLYVGETYNFTVAYDGQETTHNTDADLTLTFPSGAGTYEVTITGTFAGIYFNDTGDKLKLTTVSNIGDVGWCNLNAAFYGCSNCTNFLGSIPYNVNITTLSRTWNGCSSATSFPDVSALTLVTTLSFTWRGCSSATSFPDVSALTLVTTLSRTWRDCSSCVIVPVLPTSSTALVTTTSAFEGIGSGMLGTAVDLWNVTNFPNISFFGNTFTGATGLTNYASIPNGWKGL